MLGRRGQIPVGNMISLGQLVQEVWVGLFVILILVGAFKGEGLVFALGLMGALIWSVSWLWNKLSLEQVSYDRHLPTNRAFVGEELLLDVTLDNSKAVPLGWIRVEDRFPNEIHVIGADMGEHFDRNARVLRHSTSMAGHEKMRWEYRLTCSQRGLYQIGPAQLRSRDLFGFFSSERLSPQKDYLLVYPKIVPLHELGLPAITPIGEVKGGSRMFQDVTRPSSVRDYQRGDPLRWVDWKLSAKSQRLQVRSFDPSSTTTLILVVAVDTVPRHWEGHSPVLLERVITASASLASYASERRYALGLFSNGSAMLADRPVRIQPSTRLEQLTLVLEALATIPPFVAWPMAKNLADHARRFTMGSTVVIVAALVTPELVEATQALKDRGHPLALIYVGDEPCAEMPDGVVVHDLRDYFNEMEMAGELGPG